MVPVALHAWLSHPGDVRTAVLAAVHCGGDTDTTAAITRNLVFTAIILSHGVRRAAFVRD